jgi:hypothetical protein
MLLESIGLAVPAIFNLLADATVVFHVAFVLFVVLGGLLVVRWPRVLWFHLPAAAWGISVEFADWLCPLTPLENLLREKAGKAAYQGDFIDQHLLPLLYPNHLTRITQVLLGVVALVMNALIYWRVIRHLLDRSMPFRKGSAGTNG